MHEKSADTSISLPMSGLYLWLLLCWSIISCIEPAQDATQLQSTNAKFMEPKNEYVCNGGDFRNNIAFLYMLQNCTVIEGHLKILFYEKKSASTIRKLSFPKLREITGYLLLHRVYGLRSIGQFFPNLAVIRGRELFFDYALVAYEMPQLEEVGLRNLQTIMRGAVRLEKNNELCYVNSIDWKRIILYNADDNFFLQNKMVDECDVCPTKCAGFYRQVALQEKHCWNADYCQRMCPDRCDQASGCRLDDRSVCCHSECVGGCYGLGADQCVACKNVFHNGVCMPKCPPDTYKYHDRRCLSADQCRRVSSMYGSKWKPFDGDCINECPSGYKEDMNDKSLCLPCNGPCPKVCSGIRVDSVSTAQKLRGCTIISSHLEIQITKGSNIIQELEDNLSDIEEVHSYLKITRSAALVSLSFLKKLRLIKGQDLKQSNGYSLYVVDNRNLQEIWNMTTHPKLQLLRGSIFFDLNRRLCVDKIYDLTAQLGFPNPPETNVSTKTNGDEGACNVGLIEAEVQTVGSQYALVKWKPFIMVDSRYLMGYIISYRQAPYRNVSIFDQRDACGNDVWRIEDYLLDERNRGGPNIHLLSELEPWKQYVVYVQTYTVALSKESGRSELLYFTTLPDVPTQPRDLKVENEVPGELLVRWKPPRFPKGNVTHYHVYWFPQELSREKIDKRDYCTDKIQVHDKGQRTKSTEADTPKTNQTCDCNKESKQQKALDNERRFQIEFENYLHNYVYRKRPTSSQKQRSSGKKVSDIHLPFKMVHNVSSKSVAKPVKAVMTKPEPKPVVEQPTYETVNGNGNGTTTDGRNASVNETATDEDEAVTDGDRDEEEEDEMSEYLMAVVYEKLEVVLPNLKHFQTYNIEVMACQEYRGGSRGPKLCSNRAIISGTTQPRVDADDIDASTIRAKLGKHDEIIIYWAEPEQPNGMIVTYEIQWARDVGKMEVQVPVCVPHKDYRVHGSYNISGLTPGNYSFRIRATSLFGVGKWTPDRSFQIPKRPMTELAMEAIIGVVVAVAFVVIVLAAAIISAYFYISKRSYLRQMPDILYSSVNPEYMSFEYTPDEWEVDREKVELGKSLGQGSFGMVYQGIYRSTDQLILQVAVKTVNANASEHEKRSFLREASTMKAFACHHVVRLMGVVSQGQPVFVLMELMANGDLKTFLRSRRPDYNDGSVSPPTTTQLWRMAAEIADGMAHLASKKYVHRDLAARNCMVAGDMTVKIGDFGMTRDIYETDYYKKGGKGLLPVRWMAPESLRDGVFATSSDVWSYGVVLWEMSTLAAQPYQGYSNEEVLDIVVKHGYMERPQGCPKKLYELMTWCWQYKEKDRPTFGEIIDVLIKEAYFDSDKFCKVSFYLNQDSDIDNELQDDTPRGGGDAAPPAASPPRSGDDVEIELNTMKHDELGHISPSHRPSVHDDDVDDDVTNVKVVCTDTCDSSSRNNKQSAISNSCSADSSRGSIKSNSSALTNGLINGHAHRPVHC